MKKKIRYQDKEVDALVIHFDPIQEPWAVLDLNDGTSLRIKHTVVEVFKVEGEYHKDGTPMYVVRTAPPIIIADVPEQLRGPT